MDTLANDGTSCETSVKNRSVVAVKMGNDFHIAFLYSSTHLGVYYAKLFFLIKKTAFCDKNISRIPDRPLCGYENGECFSHCIFE